MLITFDKRLISHLTLRYVSAKYPNNIKPAVVIKLKNNYQMCVLLSNQP